MFTSSFIALAACLVASASAQTPAKFNLTTDVNLPIAFGSTTIKAGQDLAVTIPVKEPTVSLPSGLPRTGSYLLNMIDPDATTPDHPLANVSEVLHWIQPGVTFSRSGEAIFKRSAAAPYLAPAPPTAPKHRYIILLFKQEKKFRFPPGFEGFGAPDFGNRTAFDALAFSRALGLGEPVAATYFLTGNDTAAAEGDTGTPTASSTAAAPADQTQAATSAIATGGGSMAAFSGVLFALSTVMTVFSGMV